MQDKLVYPTDFINKIICGDFKGDQYGKITIQNFYRKSTRLSQGANGIIIRVNESKEQYAKNIKQALFALNELTSGYEFIEGET